VTETAFSVLFVDRDDGYHRSIQSVFDFDRDGGTFHLAVSVGDGPTEISESDVHFVEGFVGHIVLAMDSEEVLGSGIIESADVIEDELLIRTDDARFVGPNDVEVDVSKVRAEMGDVDD